MCLFQGWCREQNDGGSQSAVVHPLGSRSNQRAHGDLCAILAAIHSAKLLTTNIALAGELLLCSNVFDAQSSLSIVAMERIDDAGFFRWFSFCDVTVNGDGGLARLASTLWRSAAGRVLSS